jgi:tRNA nucleotidyltransferase/poly(A) polymerase
MISLLEEIANRLPPLPDGAYLVGGCVRDALLGRPPLDIDISVAGNPESAAQILARAMGGRLVALGREAETLYRIVPPGKPPLDVVALRENDIFADLRRRDFTINAMAWDAGKRSLIDPAGGKKDLERGRIQPTGPDVFLRDPVRMVRAIRFAAAFGFRLTGDTFAALERHAPRLAAAPGERIREELHKLMEAGRTAPFLKILAETGLLSALLPKADPPDLSALAALEADFQRPANAPPETARTLRKTGPGDRRALRYAAFFRGWGTEAAGERLESLAERLRWSRRETGRVRRMLEESRRAEAILPEWRTGSSSETISPETARWFRSAGPVAGDALLLNRASRPREKPGPAQGAQEAVERLLAFNRRALSNLRRAGPLLGGRDLMAELGLPPGPQIGELLEMAETERFAGRLRTRSQALDRIREAMAQAASGEGARSPEKAERIERSKPEK